MTNSRVSVVQKPRYGVLFLPVLWLLFSLWAVMNDASQRFTYSQVNEINTPPSSLEILNLIYLSFVTLWVVGKILIAPKQHRAVSSELKSGFAFFLGLAVMTVSSYFHLGQFFSYVGMAFVDIAAIIMIITLLHGKPFGPMTLYHKDIQLRRTAS